MINPGPPSLRWLPAWIIAVLLTVPALADRVYVGIFSKGDLIGWQAKSFAGNTLYQLQDDAGRLALRAISDNAASGLFRETKADLDRTPYLHWSWKVENLLAGGDEQSKSGDDYPARVYVVFSGGLFFWRTRAINYVWSSNQPVGSEWPNAFTGNAKMVAVRGGPAGIGQWLSERRNVKADYWRLFGEEPGEIAAISLMTDTDNTGARAEAWYGDIWFDSE